jgi:hypothetical protein
LIDFNPRFYNQLALDVARGLPLPQMAYAAAIGDRAMLDTLFAQVPDEATRLRRGFCNVFGMQLLVGAQRVAGTMSASEASRWLRWYRENRSTIVDASLDGDDRAPFFVDVALQLYASMRHPRAFLRKVVLDVH